MNIQQKFQNSYISKKTLFIGGGIIAALGLSYLSYKFFRTNKLGFDLYKYIQMLDTIQLANQQASQSLQTLVIQKTVSIKEGKLQMLFNLITNLNNKIKHSQGALKNPFIPPFQQGIFITELQPNHRLLFNKFNIYRNHLLIVTKQFQSQLVRLSLGDFQQSIYIYRTLGGIFFFNRGPNSGASQPHKHIQIFPNDAKKLPIFKQMEKFAKERSADWDLKSQNIQIQRLSDFKFVHGIIPMPKQTKVRKDRKLFAEYMKKAENVLHKTLIGEFKNIDYNVIGCDQFLFMVPRKKQKAFQELSINSVGFMGSLLFRNKDNLNKFQNLGIKPRSILEDVTFLAPLKQVFQQKMVQK